MEAPERNQDFLDILRRARRGKLKLYIGFAAGVGKTYRMLQEAHALKHRGVDIVLGFVEPHGRQETIALIDGLEAMPRRQIEYRGVTIEEMDLDTILARRPEIAVVDEIAHTNVPGSRNRRRYQDVLDILDAGINVIGAFNVQHLESLYDLVERVSSVKVRETVPDSFLAQADQVVNLDLSVEDLLERLRSGRIYSQDKVPWALEHFFQEGTLATLREVALREVAESLDRSAAQAQRPARGTELGTVMVCMSSRPARAASLLRRGSRMAGRLNTDWYVVHVETPDETPTMIDAEAQRHLLANIEKARELGAEVVRLRGEDPVETLLEFARTHDVGQIVVGRTRDSWLRRVLRRSVATRLVDEGVEFDIHLVAVVDEGKAE